MSNEKEKTDAEELRLPEEDEAVEPTSSETEEAKTEEASGAEATDEAESAERAEERTQPSETERLKAEAEDMKRKWYAVTAEYENYRKRTQFTRSQAYAEGRADVVSKLFPVADNLERALASCSDDQTKQGIEMVMKSFRKVLEEEKIVLIDPLGEEFSAEKCEAIMAVDPEEGEASGIVKQVYLKGYEQNGKVLRFAQVVVTK